MKFNKSIWAAMVLPFLALTACNDDEGAEYNNREVRFASYVKGISKVNNSSWETNDQVGLYMIKHDAVLNSNTIVNNADNKNYVTTAGDGNFQGLNTNEAVFYPEGSTVDFISYYPYKAGLQNFTFPIDLTDQSKQSALDLLYSNNAKGMDANSNATLVYKHQLTRVVFNIASIDGNAELSGLAVDLKGFKTKGSFFLPDGTLTLTDDSKADLHAKVSHLAGGGAIAEAILLPEANISNVVVSFILPGAGTFDHKIATLSLNAGTQLNYTVKLDNTDGNNRVVVLNSNITPWNEQNGGNIDVDFGGEGGGTVEPDPDPDPSKEPTFFTETFGEKVDKKQPEGKYWPGVNEYTGWDNPQLTFTDPTLTGEFSNASVRQTSTLNPHVWFAAGKVSQLQIGGLYTEGCTNLTLTYDITFNQPNNSSGNGDQSVIKVYIDNQEITVPAKEITKANEYQTVTLSNLNAGFTSITFSSEAATNTKGYRIDNVKLSGTKQ